MRVYLLWEETDREKPNPLLPLQKITHHRVTGKKGGEFFLPFFLPVGMYGLFASKKE
jgi:hypothetical protein